LTGQEQGRIFGDLARGFLEDALPALPGAPNGWAHVTGGSIADYAQYAHLREVEAVIRRNPELLVSLGGDYIIAPDVVVSRLPLDDEVFGDALAAGTREIASHTFLRRGNQSLPILHASVSCKWTLRSDRAQNARTEALNLIRNRKGRAPVIAVVTAEPLPSRLASLADGTGDIDRVYHFALPELEKAVGDVVAQNPGLAPQQAALSRMVKGLRLADISDLPFDIIT